MSFKQFFRSGKKVFLLIFCTILVSILLVISVNLWSYTNKQMLEVESNFTTIATVEQLPSRVEQNYYWDSSVGDYVENKYFDVTNNVYDEILSEDILYFENAPYINIERRPYYITLLPQFLAATTDGTRNVGTKYVFEFTALENSLTDKPVKVNITKVLHGNFSNGEVYVWDMFNDNFKELEKGKTYIAYSSFYGSMFYDEMPKANLGFWIYPVPWTENANTSNIQEVTNDFYETQKGKAWLNLVKAIDLGLYSFPVLPTNSLELLPSFQSDEVSLETGREITKEEFESGANVCLVPSDFLNYHGLKLGDKVSLPLYTANYQNSAHKDYTDNYYKTFEGLVGENGKLFDKFFEAEYEIIGTYNRRLQMGYLPGNTEIADDMFIIPMKSVTVSDQENIIKTGHMIATTTSFQIENGTREEFLKLFNENVEKSDLLNLEFHDNGYQDIMANLKQTKLMSAILLSFGFLASFACIILFVFFFITSEKRRTAIELSLGMSKNQCRVSLISSLAFVFYIATIIGTIIGIFVYKNLDALYSSVENFSYFSTEYSTWSREINQTFTSDVTTSVNIFHMILISILQTIFLIVFSLIQLNKNLKIDPILILGKKE